MMPRLPAAIVMGPVQPLFLTIRTPHVDGGGAGDGDAVRAAVPAVEQPDGVRPQAPHVSSSWPLKDSTATTTCSLETAARCRACSPVAVGC